MKSFAILAIVVLLLLGLSGCVKEETEDSGAAPNPPRQDLPTLTEHGLGWEQYKNQLDELGSAKGAIEQDYEKWQRNAVSPPSDEPVFKHELSAQGKAIIERCDKLETDAKDLLNQTYLREHKGETADAESLISYARDIRQKIQAGT